MAGNPPREIQTLIDNHINGFNTQNIGLFARKPHRMTRSEIGRLRNHGLLLGRRKSEESALWSPDGTVTLRCREREASATQELSGLCDRVPPRGHRRSAKRTVGLG